MPALSRPWLASLLSVLVPGLGQIQIRQTNKGLMILGSALSLGLGFCVSYWFSGFNAVTLQMLLALSLLWVSAAVDAYQMAKAAGQLAEFYFRKSFVVAMLLFVGPLALPLLWQSPNFSRTARWLWTILVVGVALLFLATPYLLKGIVV